MSTVLIDLSEEGDLERLAALGIIMFVLTLALVLIGYSLSGSASWRGRSRTVARVVLEHLSRKFGDVVALRMSL